MSHSMEEKYNSKEFLDNREDSLQLLCDRQLEKYVLRLYVANRNQMSLRAFERIRKICEECLQGRYELEVIDIYQQPERLEEDQVFAIPTLVKKLPPPFKKIIGDLSETEKLLAALDICYL